MRLLALTLMLATVAEASEPYPLALPRTCRDRSCMRGRVVSSATSLAFFEFAPANGAGMGVACGACGNLAGYPQDFNNAVWAASGSVAAAPTVTANAGTAPDGTLTAERVQLPGVTSGWSLIQQTGLGGAFTESISVYAKGNGQSGSFMINLGNAVCFTCNYVNGVWGVCAQNNRTMGGASVFSVGNDVVDCGGGPYSSQDFFLWGAQMNVGATVNTYTPAPSGAKGEALAFTRSSAASCLKTVGTSPQTVANGDLVTCASGQARVMPGADGTSVNGLLDEAARTNLEVQSQSFDNVAWTKQGLTSAAPIVTADQAVAPDGTTTADRVQIASCVGADTASFVHQIGLGSTATYAGSVWCRGNGSSQTISACVQGAAGGSACTPYTCPSTGWLLISQVASITTSGGLVVGCNHVSAYTGNSNTGAADVFLWNGQFELGAMPSSSIATTAAAATRVADLADLPVSLPTLTGLSVANTIITPSDIAASQAVLTGTLGDGALGGAGGSTNFFTGQYNAGNFTAITAGAGLPTSFTGAAALTGAHRYAVFHTGAALNDCIDGVCGAGSAGAFSNPTFTRFRVGNFNATTNVMGGVTKLVCVDPSSSRCR